MNYDMVIASIPKIAIRTPPIAPGLLKSALIKNGYKCKVLDWNYDLYKRTKQTNLFDMSDWSFHFRKEFNDMWESFLKHVALEWVEELKSLDSEWVGIPLFSTHSILFAIKIMEMIREKIPDIKIVAGGDGIKLTSFDCLPNVGEYLKENNYVDHYILGEAENSIIHLLQGNFDYAGIDGNTPDPVDVNTIPTPNYDDIDIENYSMLAIVGSRGCINKCGFCDTSFYSNTFRQRKAEYIFEEMMTLRKKHGSIYFEFADNLVNGSMKEFRKLCSLLKGKGFIWTGQMVCTSKVTEEDYKNAAESGIIRVPIGVETGSEKVRKDMRKPFTNETLYKALEYSSKYGIYSQLMIIVGWPTETEEDFQETLDMLTTIKKNNYKIHCVILGGTCGIMPSTPIYNKYEYEWDENGYWIYLNNNMELRIKRWFRLREHCLSLGFKINEKHYDRLKKYMDKIKETPDES